MMISKRFLAAGPVLLAVVAAVAMLRPVGAATDYASTEIDREAAMRVIDAAIVEAGNQGVPMNIAVVDTAGHLKAFVRMDGALLGSIDISQRKAKTSALFRAPSGAIGQLAQPGQPLFGIENTNGGLVVFGGGLPLQNADGDVIGAIGVSGGSVQNDEAVAKAGAAAL